MDDNFLLSVPKKSTIVKEASLQDLVLQHSNSSGFVCTAMRTVHGFLKSFSKGGSSWSIYSVSTDPNILLKYVDYDDFKSSDITYSKAKIGTYLKHIQNEVKVNMMLKANKDHVENVLVPLDVGSCEGDLSYPFYIIMDKCDTSLESLSSKLKKDKTFLIHVLLSVIQAIRSFQPFGILHNDIEPKNILIKGDHILVSDFGISEIVPTVQEEAIFSDIAIFLSYLYQKYNIRVLENVGVDLSTFHSSIAESLYIKYKTLDHLLVAIAQLS